MSHDKKEWHPRFLKYMEDIVSHPNYKGLMIEKKKDGTYKWIATAKSVVGQQRIKWCENKAKKLNIPVQPGVYADVMLQIHPTKWKVCQTCGKEMSLYYHYPNANFLNQLNKKFKTKYTICDHIEDIWDDLVEKNYPESEIADFLIDKGGLKLKNTDKKDEIICALELACRKGDKKCLGPGAMSNFPDRFDGFHTYNRCCRSSQDKGRSKSNLKTYTKDRRAYEYWSDGNIHAANQFMGTEFFKNKSADHIGPISLGFIHDPHYLQPMNINENSSKRDRLQEADIDEILKIYKRTHVYPMSWFSKTLWEYIIKNYKSNSSKIQSIYRDALKQNMSNFMFILYFILTNSIKYGESFLINEFLKPNFHYFESSYEFDENGNIIKQTQRHYTDRNKNETDRYIRIAIESVYDFNDKSNRNTKNNLNRLELEKLNEIVYYIDHQFDNKEIKNRIIILLDDIQKRLIETIDS